MPTNDVRIAVLEMEVKNIHQSVDQISDKLDEIMDTLSQMSGGKRAMFGLFAILGGFVGAGAAVISTFLALWPRH